MKSKKTLLILSLASCATLATVAAIGGANGSGVSFVRGNESAYSMSLDSSFNKLYTGDEASDGETTLKTNLGNEVRFAYSMVKGSASAWQTSEADGYFYNVDPIHGLKNITLSFGATGSSYEILYSWDDSFEFSKELTSAEAASSFDFAGSLPNYFKVVNKSGADLDVSSVEIEYSCADDYHSLTLTSEDEAKGSVSENASLRSGEKATVKAKANDGYVFKGWYLGDDLVSSENPYTFAMPASDFDLEARFYTKEEAENLGIVPVLDSTSKTLTYGLYPQKRVSDSLTLNSLNALGAAESNGWYLLNGSYYAKTSASPYSTSNVFDDNTKIVSKTTYWFKCEPIAWKILSFSSGEYSLVSNLLLDAHRYNESYSGTKDGCYANNYKNSEIRSWLNEEFYSSAFSLGNSLIQAETIDNSASTTDSSSNKYYSDDTADKAYLLSYQDYLNADYGFSTSKYSSSTRECKTTDWARANGAYCSASSYKGWHWTRSPLSSYSNYASYVREAGSLEYNSVGSSGTSLRPAITIKLAQ